MSNDERQVELMREKVRFWGLGIRECLDGEKMEEVVKEEEEEEEATSDSIDGQLEDEDEGQNVAKCLCI